MVEVTHGDLEADAKDYALTRLIEQLRSFAQGCRGSMWQSRDEIIRLMDEAAEALTTAQAQAAAQEQRIAELEAALKPFAALADEVQQVAQACGVGADGVAKVCTWEDLARARAALGEQQ